MNGRILELISKIHLDWKRQVARNLAPFDINPKQIFLLRKLREQGSLAPSTIAVLLHADRPSVTSMLNTLEREGWILRAQDPANGKRSVVTLSAAGGKKLASVPENLWRSGRTRFDPEGCLEPEERAELERLLKKLHRWISEAAMRQEAE
jgi:DNA-binding MarR family transcriptional regulator